MSGFSAIDLTKLPAPDIIEPLDVESILAEMIEDFQSRVPDYDQILESDPAIKLLEAAAYREMLLRARINEAARSVMLAFSRGTTLDHLAAYFGVERQVVDEGDPTARPPVLPTLESDDRLRQRTQLSLEGHSTAGPVGSYIFHALAASPLVKDVDVTSNAPGYVRVTVLSTEDEGGASDALLLDVLNKLNEKHVRPLTDAVSVQSADIVFYAVDAELILYEGPDSDVVLDAAQQALREYVDRHHLLGNDITLSGIYAALHQPGVQRVNLRQPTHDLVMESHSAAWCSEIAVTVGGRDE